MKPATNRLKRLSFALAILAVVIYFLHYGLGPTSADIRLDTGDLRYRFLGIPVKYVPMPEPQRSRLLALTAGSKICTPTWVQCATYPLQGSNNPDRMCRMFYAEIDAWIDVDKKLALSGVEDIARYILTLNAPQGLPKCTPLLLKTHWDPHHVLKVEDDWQNDSEIEDYRKSSTNK